jgi:hypothetical protein
MPAKRRARTASTITFEEFTEVSLGAVLRALEARQLPRGPIIIGIIYDPTQRQRLGIASRTAGSE